MTREPLKIFISSPGDVAHERRRCAMVINRLNREFYRFFDLTPVLWEYEPMLSTGHFQDVIEPAPSDSDIVVVILWSRLGSPLPAQTDKREYKGLDGRTPVTGTEWEFEDALRARMERHKRGEDETPELLVYRNDKPPVIAIEGTDRTAIHSATDQLDALEHFWKRHFYDPDYGFKLAYNRYQTIDGFETTFEEHLRAILKARTEKAQRQSRDDDKTLSWYAGSPFLGLSAFDFEHAPVFFGRSAAEKDIVDTLSARAEEGSPFILITGASGSGKSSLARAGVLPTLVTPGVVPGVEVWRRAVMTPGGGPPFARDVFNRLVVALTSHAEALPELLDLGLTAAVLARRFRTGSGLEILEAAIQKAAESVTHAPPETPPPARLVLVIDQLEEIFTASGQYTPDVRHAFFDFCQTLVQSGLVWIVATMRSDAYHHVAEYPALRDLCAGDGQYLLIPPTREEIEHMIDLPAQAAGLSFDTDAHSGVSLAATIREAASQYDLPLLEFTLDELYRLDVELGSKNTLTFESYHKLGELEGAIAGRAEILCNGMTERDTQALNQILRSLTSLKDDGMATARIAGATELKKTPRHAEIVDRFIAARLFVSDQSAEETMIRIAHECLFEHWPRYKAVLESNREFLTDRNRLEYAALQWARNDHSNDYLLPDGEPFDRAQKLVKDFRGELSLSCLDLFEKSEQFHRTFIPKSPRNPEITPYRYKVAPFNKIVGDLGFASRHLSLRFVQHFYATLMQFLLMASMAFAEIELFLPVNGVIDHRIKPFILLFSGLAFFGHVALFMMWNRKKESPAFLKAVFASAVFVFLMTCILSGIVGLEFYIAYTFPDSAWYMGNDETLHTFGRIIVVSMLLVITQATISGVSLVRALYCYTLARGQKPAGGTRQLSPVFHNIIPLTLVLLLAPFSAWFYAGFSSTVAANELIQTIKNKDYPAITDTVRTTDLNKQILLDNRTALAFAAEQNDLQTARLLLKAGANIHQKATHWNRRNGWFDGHSALETAVQNDSIDVIKEFIGDTSMSPPFPRDLLQLAAENGANRAVLLLLERGARPGRVDFLAQTVLHAAIGNLDVSVIREVINHSLDVDAKDFQGQTALHHAAHRGLTAEAALLLGKGADPSGRDNEGRTPLHLAMQSRVADVVKTLIDGGADADAKDNQGRSPLHGIYVSTPQCAAALLAGGAQVDPRDNNGDTPLHLARWNSDNEKVSFLLEQGADPTITNADGLTPLNRAIQNDDPAIARALLRHGKIEKQINGMPLSSETAGRSPIIDNLIKFYLGS